MRKILTQWRSIMDKLDELEAELEVAGNRVPTEFMCQLLIAGEDRRFYYHPGVDPIALLRAFWRTYYCRSREGGSTIAMQLVRTISARYEVSWGRKIREIILALMVTSRIDRSRIPILYLWCAYYGTGMDSLTQAYDTLMLSPGNISRIEQAKLIARLKYPQPKRRCNIKDHFIQVRTKHLRQLTKRKRFGVRILRYGTISNTR